MSNPSSANRGALNAYWTASDRIGRGRDLSLGGQAIAGAVRLEPPGPERMRYGWNWHVDTLAAFNATPREKGGRHLTEAKADQDLGTAGIAF